MIVIMSNAAHSQVRFAGPVITDASTNSINGGTNVTMTDADCNVLTPGSACTITGFFTTSYVSFYQTWNVTGTGTTTRKFIVALQQGAVDCVANGFSQPLTFGGVTGTTVTVASGSKQCIRNYDGINFVADGGGTSLAFSGITSGTNTTMTALCGTGCSIAPTGSGTITPSNVPASVLEATLAASPYSISPTTCADANGDATQGFVMGTSGGTSGVMLCQNFITTNGEGDLFSYNFGNDPTQVGWKLLALDGSGTFAHNLAQITAGGVGVFQGVNAESQKITSMANGTTSTDAAAFGQLPSSTNKLPLTAIASIAANTFLANATSGSASPTAASLPSCSTSASALLYTTATGLSCNTSIVAASAASATTATTATTLAGGALGSVPYQSAANTTLFVASPTTSGHIFADAWSPSGSAIAPAAYDMTANMPFLASANTFTAAQTISTASSTAFTLLNPGTATSGANFLAPIFALTGSSWTGSAAQAETLSIVPSYASSGANPQSFYTVTHVGSNSSFNRFIIGTGLEFVVASMSASLPVCTTGDSSFISCSTTGTGNSVRSINPTLAGLTNATTAINNSAALNQTGAANFGSAAQTTVDASGNINTSGTIITTATFQAGTSGAFGTATDGHVSKYNGIVTFGMGLRPVVGGFIATGKTNALLTTALITTTSTSTYHLSATVNCDTSVVAATVTFSYGWTDPSNTAQSVNVSAAVCTTLGAASVASVDQTFRAITGTAINISAAISGSPNYDVVANLEQLTTN